MLHLKRLIILLVDLDAAVVSSAQCLCDALLLDGVGTTVLELESALDIVLELFEEVIKGFGLRGPIIKL